MNNEMKEPQYNLDRAIEFLENRKIESLTNITTEVEKKDLLKEFETGIQVLKDRKKRLMNMQKLTEMKRNEEDEKGIQARKDRKKKLSDVRKVTEKKINGETEKRNGKNI